MICVSRVGGRREISVMQKIILSTFSHHTDFTLLGSTPFYNDVKVELLTTTDIMLVML
jgi:hypothetical protein